MHCAIDEHAIAYQILDGVMAGTSVPPNSRGMLFSVIDSLRSKRASADELRRAERISVALHKLEWAFQRRDDHERDEVRRELKGIGIEPLHSRITSSQA